MMLEQNTTFNSMSIHLHHPLFDAIILRQGAQLIHFQPKGEKALLWFAALSTFKKGKAFRGGIPLCWPWFGSTKIPSHGFARLVEWTLCLHHESDAGVHLVFELRDSAITRAFWPHAFIATLEMKLGQDVSLHFHVTSEEASTAALHAYFTCNEIRDVEIIGLGDSYTDSLQLGAACTCHDKILHVNQPIDRIYTHPQDTLFLKEHERTVSLFPKNHSDIVVWNPWIEGAKKLFDMQEDDYTHMFCVETARISKPLQREDSLQVTLHCEHSHKH